MTNFKPGEVRVGHPEDVIYNGLVIIGFAVAFVAICFMATSL